MLKTSILYGEIDLMQSGSDAEHLEFIENRLNMFIQKKSPKNQRVNFAMSLSIDSAQLLSDALAKVRKQK